MCSKDCFYLENFLKIFIPNCTFQDCYFFLLLANFRLLLSERKMCHLIDCKIPQPFYFRFSEAFLVGLKFANLQYSSEFHSVYEYKYYYTKSNNYFSKPYLSRWFGLSVRHLTTVQLTVQKLEAKSMLQRKCQKQVENFTEQDSLLR